MSAKMCLRRSSILSVLTAIGFVGLPGSLWAQDQDELPLTGPAYKLASEAYEAFNRGDYVRVIAQAREAIRQRPDVVRLKRLLVEALIANGALEEADRTASAFIDTVGQDPEILRQRERIRERIAQNSAQALAAKTPEPESMPQAEAAGSADPLPAAERRDAQLQSQPDLAFQAAESAYKSYARKDYATAIGQAHKAVALKPGSRNYRLLLINALSAGKRLGKAEDAASTALYHHSGDREILAQRGYVRMALRRYAAAADDFSAALKASGASVSEQRDLRLALADAALADHQPQWALDALQALRGERSYAVAARSGFALLALKRNEKALEAFRHAATRQASRQEKATAAKTEIGLLVEMNRTDEARRRFAEMQDVLTALPNLELAYLATRVGDDPIAAEYFSRAQERGGLQGTSYVDAAYVAKRLYNNTEAKDLFRAGIDAAENEDLKLDQQQLFGLRREVSELERHWGVYSSLLYGAVGVAPGIPTVPTPPGGNVLQSGTEIYWRPPGIGYRNGATLEVFTRTFQTLTDETDGPTGISTAQSSVGLRWKPFTAINLVFEASHLFPIGKHARTDDLVRVAYSNGYGTDLRVDTPDWWTWQVYGELGYYLQEKQTIGTFEARVGRSFRQDQISSRLVLTPFLAIGGGYDSSLETAGALGAGAGVNIRYWFRETKYNAPMSSIDVNIQYRAKLAGDERSQGIFAGIILSY